MKASEVLDLATDLLIADLTDPATRTGLIVGCAVSAACVRSGMRFVPALVFSTAAMLGAQRLYVVVNDIHQAALSHQEIMGMNLAELRKFSDAEHRAA